MFTGWIVAYLGLGWMRAFASGYVLRVVLISSHIDWDNMSPENYWFGRKHELHMPVIFYCGAICEMGAIRISAWHSMDILFDRKDC